MGTNVVKEIRRFGRFLGWAVPYHGAGMLLYHQDAQGRIHILLGRRSSRPGIGRWSVPGGGYDQKDGYVTARRRNLKATAIRETYEETAVTVDDCKKIWSLHALIFCWELYAAPSEDMSIPKYNWEFQEMAWLPLDQLPKDILHFIRPQVRILKKSIQKP